MWLETELFMRGERVAVDAMGVPVAFVETARETENGIEVITVAVTDDGSELVLSNDDGATFEAVRARMEIPGGQIFDMTEDD